MSSMDTSSSPLESATGPQETANTTRTDSQLLLSSTPVEMSTLSSKPATGPAAASQASAHATTTSPPTSSLPKEDGRREAAIASQTAISNPSPPQSEPYPIKMTRAYSTAIGPSSDQPLPLPKDETTGPTLMITLLLTTGARHPFKIDTKYLSKRNVEVVGNDPFNLSVYKLKELILREWREEWEQKPSSPSSIRLISFGKLLDDKAPLKDAKFSHDSPNVVHMTIKPQDFIDEEDTKGSKDRLGSGLEARQRSPGCRCVIM